ncbi:MAG: cysteine protease [Acidobacteria bacterium]|nr:cysteine protease [Acidobacteriota bacterium]
MAQGLPKGLGWLPDIPSPRDYTEDHPQIAPLLAKTRLGARLSTAPRPTAGAGGRGTGTAAAPAPTAPPVVDWRAGFSPIEDQGQLGSCTANAAVALVEYMERKALSKHIDASRLFVYKVSRNLLGWTGDTGAFLRTAMGALAMFGAPPERYWPYDGSPPAANTRFDQEPTPFCYAFAADFKAIRYLKLDPPTATPQQVLANIKAYLATGFPSMFGFPVFNEFVHPTPQGDIAFPSSTGDPLGGHAIVAAGYDDNRAIGADRGALLIRNYWGTGWGTNGYAWMSYKYVTAGLAVDWWTVLKEAWVDTGQF